MSSFGSGFEAEHVVTLAVLTEELADLEARQGRYGTYVLARVKGFYELVQNEEAYSDARFLYNFRVSRQRCNLLIHDLAEELEYGHTNYKTTIPGAMKVCWFLY